MITRTFELSVPAVVQSVGRVRRQVAEAASNLGMPERNVDDVRLCVNEAVANAVVHAYRDRPGTVDVTVEANDQLVVVVRDRGRGFATPSARPVNGYGLRIISALSEASISSDDGGTEVRMTFPLGRGE